MDTNEALMGALALLAVSYMALWLGQKIRGMVHVYFPWKDPVTLLIWIFASGPALLWIGESVDGPLGTACHELLLGLDPTYFWYPLWLLAFMGFYAYGYLVNGTLDMFYVNIHTICSETDPAGSEEISPLVYYQGPDGRLYVQDQKFWSICKSTFFNVRDPFAFPLAQIERARTIRLRTRFLKIPAFKAVDVIEREIKEYTQTVGPFKMRYREYRYSPPPSACFKSTDWLVSAEQQQRLTADLGRLEMENLHHRAAFTTDVIDKAADFVKVTYGLTPGQMHFEEIFHDIAPPEPDDDVKNALSPIKSKAAEEGPIRKFGRLRRRTEDAGTE